MSIIKFISSSHQSRRFETVGASAMLRRDEKPTSARGRFQVLAIFSLLNLVNAFFWIAFAPINKLVSDYYDTSATWVNLLSAVFMLLYPPGAVLSSFLLYRWDLRINMIAAGVMMSLGGWLRYVSTFLVHTDTTLAFVCLAVGQSLAGLAQPALTNTPAKVAAEWFPNGERDMATTLASVSNVVGQAAGQVVPALVVACTTQAGGSCVHGTVSGIDLLMLIQALVSSAVTLWAVVSLHAEPDEAPSESARQRRSTRSLLRESASPALAGPLTNMREDVQKLLGNAEFVKLLLGFGVGIGFFNAVLTDLSQVIAPLYCHNGTSHCDDQANEDDAALFGGIFVGAGLLSAAFLGVAMEYSQRYRLFLKGGITGAAITVLLMLLSMRLQLGSVALAISFGLMGASMLPLLPITLQCAVECTYPTNEESSAALLMLVGNVLGLGFTYAIAGLAALVPDTHAIANDPGVLPVGWMSLSVVAFSMLTLYLFTGKYLRLQADTAMGAHLIAEPHESQSHCDPSVNASSVRVETSSTANFSDLTS